MDSLPISIEGFERVKQELERLKSERPGVIQAIKEAREEGDLSENAGYDAARERQEELRELVGAAMGSIPAEYAKLLEWKYVDNLAVREIAGTLKKTEKAIESQLTRARVAFREAFTSLAAGTVPEFGL